MMTTDTAGPAHHRVPAEHRFLGLDRRSFGHAGVALAGLALWAWLVPWVNGRVPLDDPTAAGQILQIAPGVTMDLVPGWEVAAGLRTTDVTLGGETAEDVSELTRDGVVVQIQQAEFDGTRRTLLQAVERITASGAAEQSYTVTCEPAPFVTDSGLRGLSQGFETSRALGQVYAFVIDGVGVVVQVIGAPDQFALRADEAHLMVASIAASDRESS